LNFTCLGSVLDWDAPNAWTVGKTIMLKKFSWLILLQNFWNVILQSLYCK
jgi:hypothetical protein